MGKIYPVGKLPAEDLDRILQTYASGTDNRVLVGPGVGQDAAVISFGAQVLVAKTDPITFATDQIGWYAVHINANDIAAMGAVPKWFLATILLPEGKTTPVMIDQIFAGLSEACDELKITLCGGHTEVTHGLNRPVIVGQMLGEAAPDQFVSAGDAQIGDQIILTKGIAIEATALIAIEKRDTLKNTFSEDFLDTCRQYLKYPGLSVVKDAHIAMETGGVHAMHDPTEGGLATGLREIAVAAKVGLLIEGDRLPVLPEPDALCRHYHLDPMGTIASGALVMTVDSAYSSQIINRLAAADISATVIGLVQPPEFGLQIRRRGTLGPLPTFNRDEIGKIFEAE